MEQTQNQSTRSTRNMSDAESQTSQHDSFHSPLHSPSPDLPPHPEYSPPLSFLTFNNHSSQVHRPKFPGNSNFPGPPKNHQYQNRNHATPAVVMNMAVREEVMTKMGPTGGEAEGGGVGGERKSSSAVGSVLRRTSSDGMLTKADLVFRVCELIVCLISFSVMAADKTQGWSGDSFDRYIEYRYCAAVNALGFVYAGLQACNLTYHLVTGKYFISHHLHYHFDFAMDQILAYLLISASSSAATRVDDWISNWGKDQFTEMASASVGMSFLAFAAFALSSIISGYNLCNYNFT